MRAHTPSGPRCPDCGARHYPATTGAGRRVWCKGTPADPRAEIRAGLERERRERAALLADRPNTDRPPIERWERTSAPDTMPDRL